MKRTEIGVKAEERPDTRVGEKREQDLVHARLLAGGLSAADRALMLVLEQVIELRERGLVSVAEFERIERLTRSCSDMVVEYQEGAFLEGPGELVRLLRRGRD